MDGHLIQKLKEKYCHFDMTIWGVAEEEIIVPYRGQGGSKFRIHFADELVYAPMVGSSCTVDVLSISNRPVLPVMYL